jgi:hypothetical protein
MTHTSGATVARLFPASSTTSGASVLRSLFEATTFLFVLSTLFDPGDRLLGLKLPLYVLSWVLGVLLCLNRGDRMGIPIEMVIYSLLMITIPLLSIWNYYLVDGGEPFEGFALLKAYLFISMAMLLFLTRTNLLKLLSIGLTLLALAVLAVAALVFIEPSLYLPVYVFGEQSGMFSVGDRDYGGLVLFQVFFHTSPMLAISAAYYFDFAYHSRRRRKLYGALAALNLVALILAGTRNNMVAAILLPLALALLYARRKGIVAAGVALVMGISAFMLSDQIGILLNPTEASNSTKLASFSDYLVGFSNVPSLIFGKGLGAYQHWTGRGYYYITELTYLEIVRNFGLLLGGLMMLLLLYPLVFAFVIRRSYNEKHIVIGYALYLLMCASNPLLFSSMGMLILSVITANMAMYSANVGRRTLAN